MSIDTKFFHGFNLIGGLGPIGFKKLLNHFSAIEKAWLASFVELKKAGLKENLANKIARGREKIDLDAEFKLLADQNIDTLSILDKNYPSLLKEIYDPPPMLYLKGCLSDKDEFSIGVVGARKLSFYGQQVTPQIVSDLSNSGLTIVSGLALGIDTLAHKSALQNNNRTIAVLGCGLADKVIYPRQNQELAAQIAQNGAVLSEFPPQTSPLAQYFPMRNRLIAGLSLGTLVIEAAQHSGALITARQALEQNREVFAVPGSIHAQNSIGTNSLIKMGAKLVTQASDVLEEFNLSLVTDRQKEKAAVADNPEEAAILKQLSYEPSHIDKIINNTKLSAAAINSHLSLMEVKGKVKNLGGHHYVLANFKQT